MIEKIIDASSSKPAVTIEYVASGVHNFSFHLLKDFPAFLKSKLYGELDIDYFQYFHFEISTLIGIAEREKFYRPYQV
ncbi:hypothetical protein GQ457_06G003330 [Hibiscus cannabinus]